MAAHAYFLGKNVRRPNENKNSVWATNQPPSERSSVVEPEDSQLLSEVLLLQFAEPAQGNGRLCVVDFMATMKSADSDSAEAGSFD